MPLLHSWYLSSQRPLGTDSLGISWPGRIPHCWQILQCPIYQVRSRIFRIFICLESLCSRTGFPWFFCPWIVMVFQFKVFGWLCLFFINFEKRDKHWILLRGVTHRIRVRCRQLHLWLRPMFMCQRISIFWWNQFGV